MNEPEPAEIPPEPRRWRQRFLWIAGLCIAPLAAVYAMLTGPEDISRYPVPATSPYKLPWPAGVSRLCIQSNRGVVSHRGWEEFAFDFKMPVGSDVCASRGGVVAAVVDTHDGNGVNKPNNRIEIDHGDGTSGSYLHLQKGGALVRVGDRVAQGQKIARSGHVGRSMTPHLHFHVANANGTLAISFADVNHDAGVPRMFFRYTSGNGG
jgi:murein DD-endopeptidase MepM/ murein hydrolase activator NlpD